VSNFEQKTQNKSKWLFSVYTAMCGLLFLTISAQHPIRVMFVRIADEWLFMREGMSIVSGNWLGDYNNGTLVKGVGYPLFLAGNYMTGLPVGIGQGLLYFVAVVYVSFVLSKISRNKILFFVLAALLLALPVIYTAELQRLEREYFYLSITLLTFAAFFDLLFINESSRKYLRCSIILGLLLGVFWLTREEGIWIVPAMITALACSAFQRKEWKSYVLYRAFLGSILTTLLSAALIVAAVGSLNKHFYGRFVVNEIMDSSFQSAYNALQRASYMYHKPYLPVAKQARLKIYEQSPTFATLKSYLDPDGKPSPWNYACDHAIYKNICGDIAGGWFLWAFRDAAQHTGVYKDPNTAARFYDNITREVDAACSQGRLTCLSWLPPLVPYMGLNEVLAVPNHVAAALKFIAMLPPIGVDAPPSQFENGTQDRVLDFLNHPRHIEGPPTIQFDIYGWYKGNANEWISVEAEGVANSILLSRDPSPDLVSYFSDPMLNRNRFHISGTCYKQNPCSLKFKDEQQNTLDMTLPQKVPLGTAIGGGQIYFDTLKWAPKEFPTWRTAFYERWVQFILAVKPLSSDFIIAGCLIFFAVMLRALFLHRISAVLLAASTLVIAVLSRAVLLGLVDASSFSAANYSYCAPAIPLAMIAATLATFEGICVISNLRAKKQER
jgi:hypothetical protein